MRKRRKRETTYLDRHRDLHRMRSCSRAGSPLNRMDPLGHQDLNIFDYTSEIDWWGTMHIQLGPRSTGQFATGQPTLFVILIGRS